MITLAKLSGPDVTVGAIRELFSDDHVHAAVIVEHGILVAVIDRTDLIPRLPDDVPAVGIGALQGRTVIDTTPLTHAWQRMLDSGRRRLAVITADGTYRGLLCLKQTRTGFCRDQDVRDRTEQHDPLNPPLPNPSAGPLVDVT